MIVYQKPEKDVLEGNSMTEISEGGDVAAAAARSLHDTTTADTAKLDQGARQFFRRLEASGAAGNPMVTSTFTRLAYGLGAAAFGAKLQLFGLLLLFYNQLVGLPAATVSLVLAISVVIDAIWDPVVGQLSDHTRTRLGRRHPYLYAVALPLALAFALLWRPPAGWSQAGLVGWLAFFAITSRLLISLHEIPSTALLPELARGYDERTSLLGYRFFFGTLGATISTAFGFGVFLRATPEHSYGQLNRAGYAPFGATIALVMLATIVISALGTHRTIPYLHAPPARGGGLGAMLRAIAGTLSNRNFAVIAMSGLLHGINIGVHSGLNVYFSTYFWKLTSDKLLWIALAPLPANFIAAFTAPLLARRYGKKRACITLFLTAIAIGHLPLIAALIGLMPEPGTQMQFSILLADRFIVALLATAGFIVVTSMITDIVEETELRTGRRSEGLLIAADTFLQKVSAGMAILVPGVLLALVAFPQNAAPATLDPHVMRTLAFISLPLWFVLGTLSTVVLSFYRIDRRTHEANLAELDARGSH
jgi:GPH family glycoside/pentoside/hexuronide:cation symporter